MAVQMKIPGVTFTDAADLPVVRRDSLLPAAGALMLVDATHPANPWPSGVPTNGATVPNLAWEQAATAIGSGTESSLAATIYSVGLTGSAGLVERSTKGGLHAVISPTTSFTDSTVGFNIALPSTVFDYTRANPAHDYYFSIWARVTRNPDTSVVTMSSAINTDLKFLVGFSPLSDFGGTIGHQSAINDTTGAPRYRNIESIPPTGYDTDTVTGVAATTPGNRSVFIVGNRNGSNTISGRRGKGGSRVFYRAYLEDLTVSGRSYSTVDALDSGMFTALLSTAGGRYYGDTFTDPTTIP